MSKLMKCSSSQTKYNARRVTVMKLLGTHIAHVQKASPRANGEVKEQVFKNVMTCFKILTTSAFFVELGKHTGTTCGSSEDSQLYQKARDHRWSATKKRQNQHCWSTSTVATTKFQEKNGIERVFVDEEATLPRNHRLLAANGNIGVIGKIGIVQARRQEAGGGRFSKSSDRKTRTVTSDAASGDRKRDVNEYGLSWFCRYKPHRTHVFQRFHALRTHSGASSCLCSAALWLTHVGQTEGAGTQLRGKSHGAPSTLCNGTNTPSLRSSQLRT